MQGNRNEYRKLTKPCQECNDGKLSKAFKKMSNGYYMISLVCNECNYISTFYADDYQLWEDKGLEL